MSQSLNENLYRSLSNRHRQRDRLDLIIALKKETSCLICRLQINCDDVIIARYDRSNINNTS